MSDYSKQELLPCPFCGSGAQLDDCRTIWRVVCTGCGALVLGERAPEPESDADAEAYDWGRVRQTAITLWNARTEQPAKES